MGFFFSTGVDLQAEDCGARPGALRQDAPQDRPGQKQKGGEESLKCFKMETWKMENQKEQRRVKNGNLEQGKREET